MQVANRYKWPFETFLEFTHCISPFYQQVIHKPFLHVTNRFFSVPPLQKSVLAVI